MAGPANDAGRFGRYEILDELGRGAMGVVYRARDPHINRTVAIKSVSLAGQPPEVQTEYRERFLREAEAAGRLSHPGIVTIFDVGEEAETHTPFIVMEYVKGKSLERVGEISAVRACGLVREIAEALDCAHSQGVVHRDLKPSNILLTEDGHAKIADFGVAKLNLSELTACGQILGTPAFMSPEQLSDGVVDGRSDLFSLGVILYTLLTGHRPFQGNSVFTVSFKVVHHEPVPATVLNFDLPSGLNQVVARALAKDPAERYQRGMEMALDLQTVLEKQQKANTDQETGSVLLGLSGTPGRAPTASSGPIKAQETNSVLPGLRGSAGRVPTGSSGPIEASGAQPAAKLPQVLKKPVSPRQKRGLAVALCVLACVGAVLAIRAFGPGHHSDRVLEIAPPPLPSVPAIAFRKTVISIPQIEVRQAPVRSISRAAVRPATVRTIKPTSVEPPQAVEPSRSVELQISVDHKFNRANLTVWVDDQPVLRQDLEAVSKKKFGLFGRAAAKQSQSVYITPGKHELRVNVQSPTSSYDESRSVQGDFTEGAPRVLSVTFSNNKEMEVGLR